MNEDPNQRCKLKELSIEPIQSEYRFPYIVLAILCFCLGVLMIISNPLPPLLP